MLFLSPFTLKLFQKISLLAPLSSVFSSLLIGEEKKENCSIKSLADPSLESIMARPNNRRALGDIGNLVGALSTRCVVTKTQLLQENQGLPNALGKNLITVDRPITRQFGAVLAKTQLQPQAAQNVEEKENVTWKSKQKRTMSSRKKRSRNREIHEPNDDAKMEEIDDVVVVDDDDGYSTEKNLEKHEPLSISSATSMAVETTDLHIQEPCEVEMEDAGSPLYCIDEADARNPLAVVEYIDDIYSFYRRTEILSCVPADYMSNQTDINHRMRSILVDWLIEVHHKFELMHETLFLAINIIDRYLSCRNVVRKSLQLVGITGMLLACKYEEICVPELEDFVTISDRAYSRQDVLNMEKLMLNVLQFKVTVPTPFVFMRRFLKAAESDIKMEMLCFYLVELCLVEYQMLKFPPSLLSAAAIYIGRCMLRKSPPWNKTLKFHSTYSEDQLLECVGLIEELQQNAGQGKLTSVYRKYSISKYSGVARLMNQPKAP